MVSRSTPSRSHPSSIVSGPFGTVALAAVTLGLAGYTLWRVVQAFLDPEADAADDERKRWAKRVDLGPGTSKWVIRTSQFALTARGVVFGIVGGTVIHAAMSHDPDEAEGGLEGALEMLVGHPWLLGAVGLGLVAYGVYQTVKARSRIIGI